MKYKSIYALQSESNELEAWLRKEIARCERVTDLAKCLLDDGGAALAKSASLDDLAAARADVKAIRSEYAGSGNESLKRLLPGWRLALIMRKYAERSIEINEDTKRSRRLNEVWETTPTIGPWSTPTLH